MSLLFLFFSDIARMVQFLGGAMMITGGIAGSIGTGGVGAAVGIAGALKGNDEMQAAVRGQDTVVTQSAMKTGMSRQNCAGRECGGGDGPWCR